MTARSLVFQIVEPADSRRTDPRTFRWSRAFDIALVALIVLNVVAVVLESVPSIQRSNRTLFLVVEVFSVLVFTVEYVLRVWSAAETDPRQPWRARGRFVVSPLAIVDLLAILPFYLGFLTGIDLRTLRVLRLLRLLKLSRYSAPIGLLLDALREEAYAIAAALFVLSLMLIVAASLAHLAEHEAQPEIFGTIPHALWWAVVTMTTVGYGDAVPVTVGGKIIGGLIGILGIGMVALPAGLLASGFSDQLHRRRRAFESEAEKMLTDGVISPEEGDRLGELADRIGLTDRQAAEILRLVHERRSRLVCPHCGSPVHGRRGTGAALRDS